MYVGMGSLSEQALLDARQSLPPCYNRQLNDCLEDENRQRPDCVQFEPVHAAYEQDFDKTEALVDGMVYCDLSKSQAMNYALAAAGAGVVVGLMVGFSLS